VIETSSDKRAFCAPPGRRFQYHFSPSVPARIEVFIAYVALSSAGLRSADIVLVTTAMPAVHVIVGGRRLASIGYRSATVERVDARGGNVVHR
jgi:hypothetical protein